jgi:hypothetical protein
MKNNYKTVSFNVDMQNQKTNIYMFITRELIIDSACCIDFLECEFTSIIKNTDIKKFANTALEELSNKIGDYDMIRLELCLND